MITPTTTFRDLKAANPTITDGMLTILDPTIDKTEAYDRLAELLNSNNPSKTPPTESDVTVVGGGIHGLIYRYSTLELCRRPTAVNKASWLLVSQLDSVIQTLPSRSQCLRKQLVLSGRCVYLTVKCRFGPTTNKMIL